MTRKAWQDLQKVMILYQVMHPCVPSSVQVHEVGSSQLRGPTPDPSESRVLGGMRGSNHSSSLTTESLWADERSLNS